MALDYNYRYIGRTHAKFKGKHCKLLTTWRRHGLHNVLVEFESGFRMVLPMRCLRKTKDGD